MLLNYHFYDSKFSIYLVDNNVKKILFCIDYDIAKENFIVSKIFGKYFWDIEISDFDIFKKDFDLFSVCENKYLHYDVLSKNIYYSTSIECNRKIEIKNNCVCFYLTHNNKNYELLKFEDGIMYASSIEVDIKEVYNDYKSLSELISSLAFECTEEELEQIEPYVIGFIL